MTPSADAGFAVVFSRRLARIRRQIMMSAMSHSMHSRAITMRDSRVVPLRSKFLRHSAAPSSAMTGDQWAHADSAFEAEFGGTARSTYEPTVATIVGIVVGSGGRSAMSLVSLCMKDSSSSCALFHDSLLSGLNRAAAGPLPRGIVGGADHRARGVGVVAGSRTCDVGAARGGEKEGPA